MSAQTPSSRYAGGLPRILLWFLVGSLLFLLPLLAVPWLVRSDSEERWLPGGLRGQTVRALTTDGSTGASILYGETATGLWRSVDGSRTWHRISRSLPRSPMGNVNLAAWDASNHLYAIVIEQGAPRLCISQDGGLRWDAVLSQDPLPTPVLSIVATEEGEIGLATPSGFYWSEDEGMQWQYRGGWPQDTEPTDLVVTPQGTLLVRVLGGGLLLSQDQGTSWRAVGPVDTLVLAVAGDRLYVSGQSSTARSDDGGLTWHALSKPGQGMITSLAADPLVPDTVYAGLFNGTLLRSDDGGYDWRIVTRNLGQTPLTLAVDAATRDRLYAALSDGVWRIQIVPPGVVPSPTPTATDTPTLTPSPTATPSPTLTNTPTPTTMIAPSPTWTAVPPTDMPTASPTSMSPSATPPPASTPVPPPPTPRQPPPTKTPTPVPPTDTPTSPPLTDTPKPPPTDTPKPPPTDTPTAVPPTSTPLPPVDTPTPFTPPPPR